MERHTCSSLTSIAFILPYAQALGQKSGSETSPQSRLPSGMTTSCLGRAAEGLLKNTISSAADAWIREGGIDTDRDVVELIGVNQAVLADEHQDRGCV
jgi:hypothetical protein